MHYKDLKIGMILFNDQGENFEFNIITSIEKTLLGTKRCYYVPRKFKLQSDFIWTWKGRAKLNEKLNKCRQIEQRDLEKIIKSIFKSEVCVIDNNKYKFHLNDW